MLPLFTHQKESIHFFEQNAKGLDLSDPGTGKTRVQIDEFAVRRANGGGCALIIAPKSLLRSAWADDIARFSPQLQVSIAYASNRAQAFAVEADVYITNHDAVKVIAGQKPAFFKKFDTLIVDEISAFKHHASQRSRALNRIKQYFKYRRGLTGTPSANGICDIWHQVFVIDDGKRLGKTFYGFRNAVCAPVQAGPLPQHIKWQDKPGAEATVYGLLQDMVVRHKFEECIDIPDNHEYPVLFHLNDKHRARYERMESDAILEIEVQLMRGKTTETISAIHAAALLTKLMQIASGAAYTEGSGYALIDRDRYEAVVDLVVQRKHSVVFFNWKHQRDELVKEAEKRNVTYAVLDGDTTDKQRDDIVRQYQEGWYQVLFAHPLSAAHGLTLTKGTATIWCSPTFNLEHYLQGNKRIYRAGQKQKTETIVLVAPGTVEERVWKRLQEKNEVQLGLLDLLQTPVLRAA